MNLTLLWGIRLGILLILLTPLIYSTGTVFPLVVAKAVWSRSLIEIIFAMWVVLSMRSPEYRPPRSWLVVIFALFVLTGLLAAFFGVSFQRSFWGNFERMQGVFDLAHWGLLLFVLISTVRGMAQWRLLLNAMVAVGLVMGLLGLAQRLGVTVPPFEFVKEQPRLDITLGNPTYVGGYMVTVCLVALGLLVDSLRATSAPVVSEARARRGQRSLAERRKDAGRLRALRVFWIATAVLAVWVLNETGSRGAAAGLVAGLAVTGLLYGAWGGNRPFRAAIAAIALVVVVAASVLLVFRESAPLQSLGNISPVLERTFIDVVDTSAAERSVGARIALEAFAARPVTGWGGENFTVAFHRYTRPNDFISPVRPFDRAHSKPLDVLATTGVVGIVAYFAFWCWLAWLVMSRVRSATDSKLLWLFGAGALAAYFAGTLVLFDTAATFSQFILLAAGAGSTEPAVEAAASLGLRGDPLLPAGAGPVPSERPSEPQSRERGRRARRKRGGTQQPARGLRHLVDEYAIPLTVAAVLIASLFALNYRPLRAAQLFILSGTPDKIARDYRYFPPLATYGQTALFDALTHQYPTIPGDQRLPTVQLVRAESETPLRAEPESMAVHLALAKFYRTAANDFPELLALARVETDEALRLGPHTHQAHETAVEQALAERDLEAAQAAVAVWKREHSTMSLDQVNRWDGVVDRLAEELSGESGG